MATAESLKNKGNEAFQQKNYPEAVKLFSEAISLDPSNHVLYSNRSGAYAAQGKFQDALADANKTVELKSDWAKGYSRQGTALFRLARYDEAEKAYQKGLSIEPTNALLKEGLEETKKAQASQNQPNIGDIFAQAFRGDIWTKIKMNPQVAPFLNQPDFIAMVGDVQQNPQNINKYLSDQRMMALLGALLGVGGGGEGPNEQPMQPEPTPKQPEKPREAPKTPEPKPTPMETESTNLSPQLKQAEEFKNKGNEAYKNKRFEEAIQNYTKAHELDPSNIVYLTNRAAAYFENAKYEECIKDCNEAIEEGRKQRADYKQIAKAFTRIGNAYMKMNNYAEAIEAYNHSLAEDRNAQTLSLLQKAQKIKEETDRTSYLNPQLSTEAKERGNELFKQGKFPEAVKEYTEAILRNPDDYTLYSNRAAAYTKLMQYDLGLKDCEECIKQKPDFAKIYSRKGHLHFFMKDYNKALEAYEQGLKLDENNQEMQDGIKRAIVAMNKSSAGESEKERLEKAMKDPEVQEILGDPVMRQILSDMQSNPEAARDHLKSPLIAAKIQKLMNAGVLRMG